ncbi:MAG: hypothetical protein K0S82_35 [Gaiellaceae bacterium]|jgi:hypothetical protein|nr:hypothetical protein [Gaiellaceae bacterium]
MADLKISELGAVTDVQDTDEFVLARAGTTKKIDGVDLRAEMGGGGGLFDAYAKLSDQKTTGTGGGSASATTWNVRTLQTEDSDADGIVSLSSNQFTLQAGRYRVFCQAPAHNVAQHKLRLRNVTDSTTVLNGISLYNTGVSNIATCVGEFTIASAKAFELQHYTAGAQAGNGLGTEVGGGEVEVYAVVEIWRFA